MKLRKFNRHLSNIHTIFVVLCIAAWIIAYLMMIMIALPIEIPHTLGLLIVISPIGSFVVAQVVVSYRKSNACFPKVISITEIPALGNVGVPLDWKYEEKHGYFQFSDTDGCIRIVGIETRKTDATIFPVVSLDNGSLLKNLGKTSPESGTACFSLLMFENKRVPGYIGTVHSRKNQNIALYFINANREDRTVVEEIMETLASDN